MKLLFLLLIVYEVFGGCLSGNQIPFGYTSGDFYTTPRNVDLNTCDLSSGHSCCTSDLDYKIGHYSDEWTSDLLGFFSHYQGECKGAIQGVSCVLCSQYQNIYLSVHSSISQLKLCNSYCQVLAQNCANARIESTTNSVSTQYGDDYIGFCNDLFNSIPNFQLVVGQSNNYCWSDIPECTEESYYSFYTECVNGKRSLFYAKLPDVVCAGGVPMPPVVSNLPCDLDCKIGQYASINGCAPCNPGTYSLGSAIREDSWFSWESLNLPFTTYCLDRQNSRIPNCGWELSGFEINSGAINSSQSSYLETSITLSANGTFVFNFKVDCEPYFDGLTVYVDRVPVLPIQSTVMDYTLTILNLTSGYHVIQFVYSKDNSVSKGIDRASLNLVQFSPVNSADDQCIPCRPGRYQNQAEKSFCLDCPANTYSPEGSIECIPCPSGYYSFEGSADCTPREPCTIDDVYYVYSNCTIGTGGLLQTYYPVWKSPHICEDDGNTIPPYPNTTSTCINCNPGEYRDLAGICHFCPTGTYSKSSTLFCEVCDAGSAATKVLYYEYFDAFDNGLSTNCNYFCGSSGWELHGEYIDSGSGHGIYVNSNLRLNTTLERRGLVTFYLELNCSQPCTLSFSNSAGITDVITAGVGSMANFSRELTYTVEKGNSLMQWVFTKNDPNNLGRFDNARIRSIKVTEVSVGGAYECVGCIAGSYSAQAGQGACSLCPAGTYSEFQATECTPCPDGYFSTDGSASCAMCGEGTYSNSDRSACVVTCTLTTEDNRYDLSPMVRNDDQMYGPIYDKNSNTYYLNMCTKTHNNNTCLDFNHSPIDTYACQVDRLQFGFDLGNLFGISNLRSNYSTSQEGVTIHLSNGSNCVDSRTGHHFPRQTYIDVLCNPLAGIGFPRPAIDDNVVESSKCVYEFTWESLYGCHICTEDDYTYITTKCVANKRYLQFVWRENPKACHSGVSLPDPIEIPCGIEDTTYCPPGQYLDLSETEHVCTDADPGYFSIGGGEVFDSWAELPEGFITVGCKAVQSGIRSTNGYSYLLYIQEFVETGTIKITYRLFGTGQNGRFEVYLDDEIIYGPTYSSDGVSKTLILQNIAKGHRFLKISFANGVYLSDDKRGISPSNDLSGRGVLIEKIEVLGIYHAADHQLPCPAGSFSTGGANKCTLCPEYTYSDEASPSCTPCEENSYSLDGSSQCIPAEPCTLDDYLQVYSYCNDNTILTMYFPLNPTFCDINEQDDSVSEIVSQSDNIPCNTFPCPPGEYRTSDDYTCRLCEVGTYWDQSSNKCAKSDPGYAGLLQRGWFYNGIPNSEALPLFSASCSGSCASGWRSRTTYIDSGVHGGKAADTTLELNVTLIYDGSITFDYAVEGPSQNGLFFFINHVQQNLDYHPTHSKRSTSVTFPLDAGLNTIRWVYHQEDGEEGVARLENFLVIGLGGATNQIECPAGSYSSHAGSNTCDLCPVGYYSSKPASTACSPCGENQFVDYEGATQCNLCGENTKANSDRSDCISTCIFETNEGKIIDFNPLSIISSGPFDVGLTNLLWLNICHKVSSTLLCIDDNGNSIETYACQVNKAGAGIDSGRILSAHIDDNNDISMIYTNGQTTEQCSEPIQTELHFHCDPSTDVSIPYPLPQSTSCHIVLQWNISYACPICDEDDYLERVSDCEDGLSTSAYIRQSECFGPAVKDANISECSEAWSITVPIIIAIVIVFVILLIVIIIIIIWNGKIHSDYAALKKQKESGDYEMSEHKAPEVATE